MALEPKKSVKFKAFKDLLIKATNKSNEGITISAMDQPDRPLIFVNDGFETLTGYLREEVVGKNCRFLQGNETDRKSVDELRRTVRNGEETTVELLNYKKDGTPFWNRLSITPLQDENGVTTHYVGVQSDITELRETQKSLEVANKELASFQERINFELDQARDVQDFILPSVLPETEKVRFSAIFEPMDKIGGDFYDIMEVDKGVYGLLIADVTGHGIQAALLTFMTSFAFKNLVLQTLSTSKVVTATNEKLYNRMPNGSFITMFYAIYDAHHKTLTYTQAGHPEGFVLRQESNEIISLTSEGQLVGAFRNEFVNYTESKIQLRIGDKLILYTDAILEVRNTMDVMIKREEFTSFLINNSHRPINDLLNSVRAFGLDYSGKECFSDDFTLLGFEVLD